MAGPWAAAPTGLLLYVRLTPKGGRDSIDGIKVLSDGRAVLAVKVRAAPSEGAANTALVTVLAKAIGVAASRVSIVAGATARTKRVMIEGDAAALAAALTALVE